MAPSSFNFFSEDFYNSDFEAEEEQNITEEEQNITDTEGNDKVSLCNPKGSRKKVIFFIGPTIKIDRFIVREIERERNR